MVEESMKKGVFKYQSPIFAWRALENIMTETWRPIVNILQQSDLFN